MSEVGNKHLAEHDTTFNYLTYVYKDKEYFNFAPPEQSGGTIIKICKITPKQVIAKFYRYEGGDMVDVKEETSQPSCRYKVWCDAGSNEPYIQLKKSKSTWENNILKDLAFAFGGGGRFYFNDKYLDTDLLVGEPGCNEPEEWEAQWEAENEIDPDYLAKYTINKGYITNLITELITNPIAYESDENPIDKTILVKLATQINMLQP